METTATAGEVIFWIALLLVIFIRLACAINRYSRTESGEMSQEWTDRHIDNKGRYRG